PGSPPSHLANTGQGGSPGPGTPGARPRHAPSTKLGHSAKYGGSSRKGTVSTGVSDQHSTVEFTSPILPFAQAYACRLALSPCLAHACKAAQLGGRCETRTRISRVQAVGNPLIRTAQPGEPTRAPNQREQLARAQQLGCGALT